MSGVSETNESTFTIKASQMCCGSLVTGVRLKIPGLALFVEKMRDL
jgi:hypothetical protein